MAPLGMKAGSERLVLWLIEEQEAWPVCEMQLPRLRRGLRHGSWRWA